MSRRRAYSPETLETMRRFFAAFDESRGRGLVDNVTAWLAEAGIDKRHFYAQRRDLYKGYFETAWLTAAVTRLSVSPMWLLTGSGPMYLQ